MKWTKNQDIITSSPVAQFFRIKTAHIYLKILRFWPRIEVERNSGVGGSWVCGSTISPAASSGQRVFLNRFCGSYWPFISHNRCQFLPKQAFTRSAGSCRPRNYRIWIENNWAMGLAKLTLGNGPPICTGRRVPAIHYRQSWISYRPISHEKNKFAPLLQSRYIYHRQYPFPTDEEPQWWKMLLAGI